MVYLSPVPGGRLLQQFTPSCQGRLSPPDPRDPTMLAPPQHSPSVEGPRGRAILPRTTTNLWRRMMLVAGIAGLGACSGPTGPAPIEVERSWLGTIQGTSSTGTIQFTLTETSGTVTGSGSIGGATQAQAVQITGTYVEPHAALTLTADGFSPVSISATLSKTQLIGSANGSGFVGSAVSMTRQ